MAAQLLAGLVAMGHRIEAIAPITAEAQTDGELFRRRSPDIETARFQMPYLDTSPDTPPSADYRQLERRQIEELVGQSVAQHRPDVLIIGRESFAAHCTDLARIHSLPSVLLIQGATAMGILNGSYPKQLAASLLRHFRKADISVVSAHHVRCALAHLGVPGVEIIPNPVDVERFRPGPPSPELRRELAVSEEDVIVTHISNLKPLKRAQDFVDAAEIAVGNDDRLVFVVVGDGHCHAEIERACTDRGLSARFRFTGWLDYERIPEIMNTTEIVVMPSAAEAQALVYLETQACARTLIASDIPAAREVIDDGETGLLFPVSDVAALAEKILLAARDPDLRARLGTQGRRQVMRHSVTRVADAYSRLLESVVNTHAAPERT